MSVRRRIEWLLLPAHWVWRGCFDWDAAKTSWALAFKRRARGGDTVQLPHNVPPHPQAVQLVNAIAKGRQRCALCEQTVEENRDSAICQRCFDEIRGLRR